MKKEEKGHIKNFNYQFKTPCVITISGNSSSGKTTLLKQLLERSDEIFDKKLDKIIYCYSIYQPELFEEIAKSHPNITFQHGLPEFSNEKGENLLFVLDDLLHESTKNKAVHNAVIRDSHHLGINICFVTQNFFEKGIRPITLGSHYIIIKNNPRDSSFLRHLSYQMSGGKRYYPLEAAYAECCKIPYSHIVIDFTQSQNPACRVRLNCFPEEAIYFVENSI